MPKQLQDKAQTEQGRGEGQDPAERLRRAGPVQRGAPCQCKMVPRPYPVQAAWGMSTGPKTPEGRARSSEGARRYFAERPAKSTLG